LLGWFAVLGAVAGCATAPPDGLVPYRVEGDSIPEPLARFAGDAVRGRDILAGREGNCLLCRAAHESGARFMGNIASPLSGVGARLSGGQLRLRIVDSSLVNRDTIMPAYYRVQGLNRVAEAYRGKPILTAQQVEDMVAYLLTLR
jgi:sulfur-oxidizing protein SoxX